MAIQSIKIQDFSGGMGTISEKKDIANSARLIKGLNLFEDPSYITQAKQKSKVSSTTVTGLIHWFADGSPHNTNRYAYDADGVLYQINSSDTFSSLRTVSGSSGEGMIVHDNSLYYAQDTDIGQYYPLDNSPSFTDAFSSWGTAADIQQTGGGTGASDYVPQTSITETATHRQTFTPDHDPVVSIVIDVDVVGTGDWTVTLHDRANRSVGAKTIANGSMSTGNVTFTFSSVLRVEPGDEYHFHVTSTVADGGLDTDIATDHEGADFTINYAPLISATFHPMIRFFGGFAIGNERHIAFFDSFSGEYNPTKIELEAGYEVRNLFTWQEYLVAEAWRGQSFSEAEESRRYYWNGLEEVYNFSELIPQGAPNAARTYRNEIVGVYGNRGSIYTGGKDANKITDEVPQLTRGKTIEVYPGAINEYEERLVVGYGAITDDGTGVEQGVLEYGSQISGLPNVVNYPYFLSTSTTRGTTLKIGAVGAFGTDLYIGWRDASSYGVDKVETGNTAVTEGQWDSRIFDAGDPDKYKQAIKMEMTFSALTTGQSVQPGYKLERASSFTYDTATSTSGATSLDLYLNTLFKEIELSFILASSSETYIKVTGINFIYNDLIEESDEA